MLLDMLLVLLAGLALGGLGACLWQYKRQDDDLLRQMNRWRKSSGDWGYSLPGFTAETQKNGLIVNDSPICPSKGLQVCRNDLAGDEVEPVCQILLSKLGNERQAEDRQARRNAEVRR